MSESNINITQSLMQMGLSEREAKVYRVLLGVDEITASGIPKFTDIPRTKVYEALTSLIKKGFCREVESVSGSQMYTAVDPRIALEGVVRVEEDRINSLRSLNANLGSMLFEIYNNSALRLKDYDFVQILRGRLEIVNTYIAYRKSAKTEILELSTGAYVMQDSESRSEAEDNVRLMQQGLDIRVIYQTNEIGYDGNSYFHTLNFQNGLNARTYSDVPVKMSLIDKKTILLPLSDPLLEEPNLTVLLIEHSGLYAVLREAFESYWEKSEPVTMELINRSN